MKILQLVTKRQYRGAEVFAANLSSELIGLGHEIIFAGLYKNEDNILKVDHAENIDVATSKTGVFSVRLIMDLVKLINSTKPDIVQCNGSDTLKYMVAASFFTSKTPILYRNISMISEWVNTESKKRIYKNIFKRIDHVSSVGQEAIEDFIKTFDYPQAQTSVIRRGIPLKEINSNKIKIDIKSHLGIGKNDKIAMHIGNFSPEKNHHFLLEVFSKIKTENPTIKLICVGSGILFDEVKQAVKEMNLEGTVFLLGFRKDIPELLSASDCFVLSSLVEGVPGVILEAGAQRIPSVATNVGGTSEVLVDGKTGYLINDFNQDEFKNKLIEIMLDEPLRKELGKNAYKLVYEEYNPRKNAKKFESLYRQLL